MEAAINIVGFPHFFLLLLELFPKNILTKFVYVRENILLSN